MSHQPNIILCKDFDASKLTFSELDMQKKDIYSINQCVCFAYYEYFPEFKNKFLFKTNPIKLKQYGIPYVNEKTMQFIKSDKDREYFKLPYDKSQSSCNDLFKMLSDIDARVLELQPMIFGTNAHKYKYVPLVRHPDKDEDYDYVAQKMDFCKIKFEVDYYSKNITTGIFVNENGKSILRHDTQTVSDIVTILRRNSEARFIITISKLWAEKIPKIKGEPKDFGLTLKCKQLEVYDKPKNSIDFPKTSYFDFPQHNDQEQEQVQYIKKEYYVTI